MIDTKDLRISHFLFEMFEPRINKDGSKTIRVINVRRCAVNWFNESIPEVVFNDDTQIDVNSFMKVFEKYH